MTRNLFALLAIALIAIGLAGCMAAPAPAPAPAPEPVACAQDMSPQSAVCNAFSAFGQGVIDQAGRVVACESGWNPMAISPNGYYQGLFQLGDHIVAINAYGGDRLDAWQNAQAARDLYVSRGNSWSAWQCRP